MTLLLYAHHHSNSVCKPFVVLLRQEPTAFTLITGLLLVEPAAIGLRLIHCHSPVVHVGIDGVIAQVRSLPKFSNYIELGTVMNKMDSCGRYRYELSTVMNYAELSTVRLGTRYC